MSTTTRRPEDEEEVVTTDTGATTSGFTPTGAAADKESLYQQYNDFTYDNFTQGTDYQSLVNRYRQEGQNASKNTMAAIAARTGGIASSYATAASQQAYNDYMTQLEDAARGLYDSQKSDLFNKYTIAANEYNTQYGNYWDEDDREYDRTNDAQTDAQEEFKSQLANGYYNNKTLTEEELAALSDATGWDAATINAYIAENDRSNAQDTKDSNDKKLTELLDQGMTIEQIKEKYPDLLTDTNYDETYWTAYATNAENDKGYTASELNAQAEMQEMLASGMTIEQIKAKNPNLITSSGQSEDYWNAYATNQNNNKEYTQAQLIAQDDMMVYIKSGKAVSEMADEEIAKTGKSRDYWTAYEAMLNSASGTSISLEDAEWLSTLILDSDVESIENWVQFAAQYDEDFAFNTFAAWARLSPENQTAYDEITKRWDGSPAGTGGPTVGSINTGGRTPDFTRVNK